MTVKESETFFEEFLSLYRKADEKEVIFCPSFTTLPNVLKKYSHIENISFGAQNVSGMDSGAYTGEISASMLNDLRVEYCIVGHSERRNGYAETDRDINQKVKILINKGITPILCVGETLSHRENGQSNKIITNQLSKCLSDVEKKDKIIIAYEPIWAIGSGKNASVEDISSMNVNIKNYMNGLGYIDEQFYILYGGSVGIDNLLSIKEASFLDGFLIGGSSLCSSTFWKIIDK